MLEARGRGPAQEVEPVAAALPAPERAHLVLEVDLPRAVLEADAPARGVHHRVISALLCSARGVCTTAACSAADFAGRIHSIDCEPAGDSPEVRIYRMDSL